MAARTCLLCGKPLSRIWAGTGEDFCSREHRNQYRLRKGMGRLMEASAVASVMRRRENPKQIPTGDLRAPGPAAPRGFHDALRRPPAELSIRVPRPAGKPKVQPATRAKTTRSAAGVETVSRGPMTPAKFKVGAPQGPKVETRAPATVKAAPPAKARPRSGGEAERQAPRIAWKGTGKPKVEALLARSEKRTAATMPEARPARRVTAARLGRALRVSTAAGFRLPERSLPSSRFEGPELGGLPTPEAKTLAAPAAPAKADGNVLVVEIPAAEARIPRAPEADFERRFEWPGVMEMNVRRRDAANEARPLAVPFGPPDESKERK